MSRPAGLAGWHRSRVRRCGEAHPRHRCCDACWWSRIWKSRRAGRFVHRACCGTGRLARFHSRRDKQRGNPPSLFRVMRSTRHAPRMRGTQSPMHVRLRGSSADQDHALTGGKDPFGLERQREQRHLVAGADRIDGARQRIGERGRDWNDSSLADGANAERICARWGIDVHDPDARNLGGGRHKVIGERSGQRLPVSRRRSFRRTSRRQCRRRQRRQPVRRRSCD